MKIKIRNFQSLRSEELDLTPGLILLNGPTNSGKTAVFRALLSFLTNPAGAERYINGSALQEKESAELSVTMIDSDIPKIEFHRNKSSAWYMIDGKKYSKLKRSNLFDLYPELNKKFIYEPSDPRKVLNFQTEEQLAFPFDRSDAEMFKLFERIFNITDTRAVIDTLKKEKDETRFRIDLIFTEKEETKNKLDAYKSNLGLFDKNMLLSYKNNCINSWSRVESLKNKIHTIQSYAPYLKSIKDLPEFLKIDGDESFNRILVLRNLILECQNKAEYLKNYEEIKLTETSEEVIERVQNLKDKIETLCSLQKNLEEQKTKEEIEGKIIKDLEEKLGSFKICPLCGHEL